MNKAVLNKSAVLSADGVYRYQLAREWDADLPTVGFIMLNPSTADAEYDDPTIKKCVKFAQRWGYGALIVGNLYAYRATNPRELQKAADRIGPGNDEALSRIVNASEAVVCAWGASFISPSRVSVVRRLLGWHKCPAFALRITAAGHPGHPLYIRDDTALQPYA